MTRYAALSPEDAPGDETARPQHVPALGDQRAAGIIGRLRTLQLAMTDAVLAGGGIEALADLASTAAGGPVVIAVPNFRIAVAPRACRESVAGAELDHWVSERIREGPVAVPRWVVLDVPIRFRGRVEGVVALLHDPNPHRPEAFDVLCGVSTAVLMELAIVEARAETEQSLRDAFLEELRSRSDLGRAEIVRRAARFGCDLSGGAVVLCAELESDRPGLVEMIIGTEHPGAVSQRLESGTPGARPRVCAVLPAGRTTGSQTLVGAAQRLAEQLSPYAVVGVSSFRAEPEQLREAIVEAELVLDVMRQSGKAGAFEAGGGIYKLLFRMVASHPEEVRSFHDLTLGAIMRHDDQYQTGLVETLAAYLDSNCNMNGTAATIFAHRHTVAYRLRRVQELTGLDPMVSEDRERLGIGLKIHRLIAAGTSG